MDTTTTIPTKFGPVLVTIQDHDTAYVRVATGDNRSALPSDELEPLKLPRGAEIAGRAHFTLKDGVWTTRQPFWKRAGQSWPRDEPTPTMVKLTSEAVAEALAEHVDTSALDNAGRAKANADAIERRATAAKLRETAAALEAEADALEAGGTVVYMENRYRGGSSDRTKHIRTAAGELMPAVPAPPTVYGAKEYPNHIPTEVGGGARRRPRPPEP